MFLTFAFIAPEYLCINTILLNFPVPVALLQHKLSH